MYMVTGDHEGSAAYVGQALGIPQVKPNLRPFNARIERNPAKRNGNSSKKIWTCTGIPGLNDQGSVHVFFYTTEWIRRSDSLKIAVAGA